MVAYIWPTFTTQNQSATPGCSPDGNVNGIDPIRPNAGHFNESPCTGHVA